jgi:hypothetical protein
METPAEAVDAALDEATRARALVSKVSSKQVAGVDLIASLKSTAYAWFNAHRPRVLTTSTSLDVSEIDSAYNIVLRATARRAAKSTYLTALADAKTALVALRPAVLTPSAIATNTDDIVPDFSALVGSPEMRIVLARRWGECQKCVAAEAHLAAIVMMGGLLEALFVARANKLTDKRLLTTLRLPRKTRLGGPLTIKIGCSIHISRWGTS